MVHSIVEAGAEVVLALVAEVLCMSVVGYMLVCEVVVRYFEGKNCLPVVGMWVGGCIVVVAVAILIVGLFQAVSFCVDRPQLAVQYKHIEYRLC